MTLIHSRLRVLLALGLAMAVVGLALMASQHAEKAQAGPPGCVTGGSTQLSGAPGTTVHHGDTITYSYTVSIAANQCDITNFDATLVRPGGVSTVLLTNAAIPSNSSITCPGGAGCAPGPYTYVVAHADEIGPFGVSCPPLGGNPNPPRQVAAYVQGGGVSQGELPQVIGRCDTFSNPVMHTPSVATEVHKPPHVDITNGAVALGVPVHDKATVSAPAGLSIIPAGTVDFAFFNNGNCDGAPVSTENNVALDGLGVAESTPSAPSAPGSYGYKVHYDGQTAVYDPADGICEPFTVVDARIRIAPNGSNPVGSPHTFTCTIEVNSGGGFAPAPDGTQCNVSIVSGPGSVAPPFCLTVGGSCTVIGNSAVTGVTVVKACTTFTFQGVTFTNLCTANVVLPAIAGCPVSPGDTPFGLDAVKCWVDARIRISPNGTNVVGDPHTFTCTIQVDNAGFVEPAPDGTQCNVSIVSGPGSITGSPCSTTAGSCSVTGNSALTGLTQVRACATFTFQGVTFTNLCTAPIAPAAIPADCEPTPTANPFGVDALKCWTPRTPVVNTNIHDANHNIITSATIGAIVHDEATVAKAAGTPAALPDPSGTVTFTVYLGNTTCSGSGTSAGTVTLVAGVAHPSDPATVPAGGLSYKAHYNSDGTYAAADGPCEDLTSSEIPRTGRMTGGGSVFKIDGARVTRGFEIHCDLRKPNNIQVNWPGGNNFHLTSLTAAVCTEDPAIIQKPPAAPFDTFTGEGTGKLNGKTGATIHFVFVDAGEPGKNDTALIQIWDAAGNLALEVSGFIDVGNMQAHKD